MYTPIIRSLAVIIAEGGIVSSRGDRHRRASRLQTMSPENDDDYPVPQVRATHAPLQPTSFGGMRAKPKWTAARKLTPGDDDDSAGALLQVASPPMGANSDRYGREHAYVRGKTSQRRGGAKAIRFSLSALGF
jgi:hypothetical protein